MKDERSAETSQAAVLSGEVAIRWPDENGPWQVTTRWAVIDGRPVIVDLALQSVFGEEITQRVLRSISISRVRDLTRQQMIERSLAIRSVPLQPDGTGGDYSDAPIHSMAPDQVSTIDAWSMVHLTAKGEPRKRRPPADDDLLRTVAALYQQAVNLGDKAPAKYVDQKLREAGKLENLKGTRALVRQWIRRARERGYLTIPPRRTEGT